MLSLNRFYFKGIHFVILSLNKQKQARRLYEIMLLRKVNKADEEQYRKYRIQVKNRLNAPFQVSFNL